MIVLVSIFIVLPLMALTMYLEDKLKIKLMPGPETSKYVFGAASLILTIRMLLVWAGKLKFYSVYDEYMTWIVLIISFVYQVFSIKAGDQQKSK